ncbi:hypothetical protein, partial [Klebsiella pneumoniae]
VVEVEEDEIEEVGGADAVAPQPQDVAESEVPASGSGPVVDEVQDFDPATIPRKPYLGGETNNDTGLTVSEEQVDAWVAYHEANPGATLA